MSDLNIYQRINAVMKKVEYVQKDAEVQGYKAVTHDMVTSVVRPYLVEHGIVVQLEQLRSEILVKRDVNKGEKMHLYSGDYAVSFVNIDKPEDRVTVTVNAHAADNGDKAPGKAASYATKYAMLKLFTLETGESDEGRGAEFKPFTELQKDEFDEFIAANNDPLGFLCFTKTIGDDAFNALQKTFEAGKIVSGKTTANGLVTQGFVILKAAAEQIQQHMDNNDTDGLLEILAEFDKPVERKLLGGLLTPQQIKALKDVQELAG